MREAQHRRLLVCFSLANDALLENSRCSADSAAPFQTQIVYLAGLLHAGRDRKQPAGDTVRQAVHDGDQLQR